MEVADGPKKERAILRGRTHVSEARQIGTIDRARAIESAPVHIVFAELFMRTTSAMKVHLRQSSKIQRISGNSKLFKAEIQNIFHIFAGSAKKAQGTWLHSQISR